MTTAPDRANYKDPSPNNFPNDYDFDQVDPKIKLRTKRVREAMSGADVRGALAQSVEIAGITAGEAQDAATAAVEKSDDNQKRLVDQLAANSNGDINLSEVVDARRPASGDAYKTIGDRLDAHDKLFINSDPSAGKAALAYLNNDSLEVDGKRPSYYQQKLTDMAGLIDGSKFNLALITDNHYQADNYSPHSLGHYANIAALSRIAPIDAIVSGGDNINGDHYRDQTLVETRQATSTLYYRAGLDTDVFFALGNHDTGAYQGSSGEDKTKPEYCIRLDEVKDFYNSKASLFGEVREDDSFYFYKDYPSKKIRLIVLNSFDFPETVNEDGTYKYNFLKDSAYRNSQLNWLANSALMLPNNDWQVVIYTHCPLPGTFEIAAGSSTPLSQTNSESLIKIINAFQAGSNLEINDDGEFPVILNANYTAQGKGTVISLISGHIHQDGQMNYRGINCIETGSSFCYSGDTGRVVNTETEDLWDLYEIDSVNRSIRIMRFGAGNDRMYNY